MDRLIGIMESLGMIIDQLEEMNEVLKLQAVGASEERNMELKSVINVQIRLLEQVISDSNILYKEVDATSIEEHENNIN